MIYVLKYVINSQAFAIVVKAPSLMAAKDLIERTQTSFDKVFAEVISEVPDEFPLMLVISVPIPWH